MGHSQKNYLIEKSSLKMKALEFSLETNVFGQNGILNRNDEKHYHCRISKVGPRRVNYQGQGYFYECITRKLSGNARCPFGKLTLYQVVAIFNTGGRYPAWSRRIITRSNTFTTKISPGISIPKIFGG